MLKQLVASLWRTSFWQSTCNKSVDICLITNKSVAIRSQWTCYNWRMFGCVKCCSQRRARRKTNSNNGPFHLIYAHPSLLRGLFTIPLGYKKFWTLLDAVLVSHPIGYLTNPLWISFFPPWIKKFLLLRKFFELPPLENLTIQPPPPPLDIQTPQ